MVENPIDVRGLDHVVLRCTRLEAMLNFYQDVLGCELERVVEDIGLYQLRAGSALIDLVPIGSTLGGQTAPDQAYANVAHFCLQLANPDWERIRQALEQRGIPWQEPKRRYGATGFGPSIYLTDPEGNGVELKDIATAA